MFEPTHEISITDYDGNTTVTPVRLVDGAAYALEEWDACDHSDWTVDSGGQWLFQGRPAPAAWQMVAVRAVQP